MFMYIELLGLIVLLWFLVNFINYGLWASSGFEGPGGALFSMSSGWIKKAKAKKAAEENNTRETTGTKNRARN
jgi:hypothetical protein